MVSLMTAAFLCISAMCLINTYSEGEAARLPWDLHRFAGLLLSFFWPGLVLCSLAAALWASRADFSTTEMVTEQSLGIGR